jgi:hypothetical protein
MVLRWVQDRFAMVTGQETIMVLQWLQDRRPEWLCDGCRTGDQKSFAMIAGQETRIL